MTAKNGPTSGFLRKIKDFVIGATVYSAIRDFQERRLLMEYGLMLAVLGDMLGYPFSTYYRLRLLPYWLPRLKEWKTFLLKEKDVTEKL
ncbi:MAG: hypothetical protein QXY88_01235 [Candidatus Bathyarchaeia archaeon]